mmetsp:Transcript_37042/g.82352  ORF Transcript_37042/g.82352 Transcript_37042/m.82352 type:complete len:1045 (-) Transcript_37042:529-3663(-)
MATLERDQESHRHGGVTPPKFNQSNRVGSVWGEPRRTDSSSQMTSPDTAVPNATKSPRSIQTEEGKRKRKEAADWVHSITGTDLPVSSDRDLRLSLRDGVLLCKLINHVCPQSVIKIHEPGPGTSHVNERQAQMENVQNFLKAAKYLNIPSDSLFDFPELTADSWENDRTRVVDCLLWLKRLYTNNNPVHKNDILAQLDSPRKEAALFDVSAQKTSSYSMSDHLSQSALSVHSGSGISAVTPLSQAGTGSMPVTSNPAAVTNILNHCNMMLKQKMYSVNISTQYTSRSHMETNVDGAAVGNVLEGLLANLTQEFEHRLLVKDTEVNRSKEKMAVLEGQLHDLQRELSAMREQLVSRQHAATSEALDEARSTAYALQQQLGQLQQEVNVKEEEIETMRMQLESQGGIDHERAVVLEEQLHSAMERLNHVSIIEQKYKTIQEENRRLYNDVQDLKGAIRIFCRIRPLGRTGDPSGCCVDMGPDGDLVLLDGSAEPKLFKFDHIFGQDSSQDEVYQDTQPLVRSVLDGYNVCILAYGQTGSGKTHTMSGTDVTEAANRGINYRALDDLFFLRDERAAEVKYDIKVQMLEVYNESLRDLLLDDQSNQTKLEILNTMPSGCNVPGAIQIPVETTGDVMAMMARGARNRHSAETRMNDRSSRSHQILTVIVDGVNRITHARCHACLHLVDLAGSERVHKSGAQGDRLTEATHINKSLSALGGVMASLASKNNHVPFRDSKLTALLQDSLSGQAKVMMFVHVAPEVSSAPETLSTLQFATRVSSITLGKAKKNGESGKWAEATDELHKAKQENGVLKERLSERDVEANKLRREVERLRAQLEHQQKAALTDVTASIESAKNSTRNTDYLSPYSARTPTSAYFGAGTPNMPDETPKSARHGSFIPRSSTTDSAAKGLARAASARTCHEKTGAPSVPALSLNSSRASQVPAPATARTYEPSSSLQRQASMSARPGGVYGGSRSALPTTPTAAPASSRTSGTFSGIPSVSGLQSSKSMKVPAASANSQSTNLSASKQVPQSAGGRRASYTGGWK